MSDERLWPVKRVAEFLGVQPVWFYRNRRALERERHFPAPLIGHRYDPLAIKAWRLAQLSPRLRAVLEAAPGADRFVAELEVAKAEPAEARDWGATLDGRAAALAGAGD